MKGILSVIFMLLGCICAMTLTFIRALVIRFVVKQAIKTPRNFLGLSNNATNGHNADEKIGNHVDENNAPPEIVIN